MAKQDTSAARRCPVRPVGAYFLHNDRRSIHYPLHMSNLKTLVLENHSKTYFHSEKRKKHMLHENVGTIHINIFKTCTALQNHVKAMHTGHLQQLIPFQNTAFSNSLKHICTGRKCPKQNKVQKTIGSK